MVVCGMKKKEIIKMTVFYNGFLFISSSVASWLLRQKQIFGKINPADSQLVTGVLSAHIAARTSVGFCANLRQDMYDNVQTFAFSNIDKFSTASIVTRLTTDVTNIQNAYQMLIRSLSAASPAEAPAL